MKENYKMKNFYACIAKTRPKYCQFDVNQCCLLCDENLKCTTKAKLMGEKIIPCSGDLFEEHEICEFSI